MTVHLSFVSTLFQNDIKISRTITPSLMVFLPLHQHHQKNIDQRCPVIIIVKLHSIVSDFVLELSLGLTAKLKHSLPDYGQD